MKFSLPTALLLFSTISFAQNNCKTTLDSVFIRDTNVLLRFVDSLAVQNFEIKNKRKDIPRLVLKALKCWGGEFRIADVGKPFNPTDVVWNNTPRRRIKFLTANDKYLILAFEQGGIAKTNHLALFEFTKKRIQKVWSGYDYIFGETTRENIMDHIYMSIKRK
ncbi:MAG TPA: hypothetical protein VIZ28_02120 [Chitinophagaceae bacterium]